LNNQGISAVRIGRADHLAGPGTPGPAQMPESMNQQNIIINVPG